MRYNELRSYKQFQFHKVRLKVACNDVSAEDYQWFQFHKVRLKGFFRLSQLLVSFKFQFHKVRLKENAYDDYLNYTYVSIP